MWRMQRDGGKGSLYTLITFQHELSKLFKAAWSTCAIPESFSRGWVSKG